MNVLALALLLAPAASAADLNVGPGQTYATPGDAFAVAVDGDRILLEPGTYTDDGFYVDAIALTFEAAAGPGTVTLENTGSGTFLWVDNGGSVTWTGIDYDGAQSGRFATVEDGASLAVSACALANSLTGTDGGVLRLRFAASASFDGVAMVDNSAGVGSAIQAIDSDLTLTGCQLSGNNASNYGTIACEGGSTCLVDSSTFEFNIAPAGTVLWVDGTTASRVDRSSACGGTGGSAIFAQSTAISVTDSVLYDHTGLTDPLVQIGNQAAATLRNNSLVGAQSTTSGHAVEVGGTASMINNLVAHNTGVGAAVSRVGGGAITADYNLFFDNATEHADLALSGTNLVDVDPLLGTLVPGNCDLSVLAPAPGSPARDAGDPSITDPDGTRSDIGAFVNLVGAVDDDGDGVTNATDCDDSDPNVYPGATEIPCDGIDQDCDPSTLDDADEDGDGVSVCAGDCDDTRAEASQMFDVYFDGDMDGYGRGQQTTPLCGIPANGSLVNGDCDDNDPLTYPGALELPNDQKDNDCDGSLRVDNDGDGAVWADDCDDLNANRYPGNREIPNDGKDQDCDGIDGDVWLTGGGGRVCGCTSTGPAGAPAWLLLPLLALLRRR